MNHESSGTVTALLAAIGANLFPGINGSVFLGAFSGSIIFVLSAKSEGMLNRGVYGCISLVCGYMFHDEVVRLTPIQNPALAAFVLSVTLITTALAALDKIKAMDLSTLWKKS